MVLLSTIECLLGDNVAPSGLADVACSNFHGNRHKRDQKIHAHKKTTIILAHVHRGLNYTCMCTALYYRIHHEHDLIHADLTKFRCECMLLRRLV
jgi:hypothetical protein